MKSKNTHFRWSNLSNEEKERRKAAIIALENQTLTVTLSCDHKEESSKSQIPYHNNDPVYIYIANLYEQFYSDVFTFMRNIAEINIFEKGMGHNWVDDIVTMHLSFTLKDKGTSSSDIYEFESCISDHILPEDLEDEIEKKLLKIKDNDKGKTDVLPEPVPINYHINYPPIETITEDSYEAALEDVKSIIKSIMKPEEGMNLVGLVKDSNTVRNTLNE